MTREDLEKLWPILEAYRQGKKIEVYNPSTERWNKTDDLYFYNKLYCYRVASEPKYRPFQNSEECLEEMVKHQPVGWIKSSRGIFNIFEIGEYYIVIAKSGVNRYDAAINDFVFVDGAPFGIIKRRIYYDTRRTNIKRSIQARTSCQY